MSVKSVFILSHKHREVIIERHYRGFVNRSVVDYYWDELNRVSDPTALVPVLTTPKYYLIHIFVEDLIWVAPVEGEFPPLSVIEWLHRVVSVLKDYFGKPVVEDIIKDNFVMVYELLDEMMDAGYPFTTEPNVLKGIVAPKSFMGTMFKKSNATVGLPDGQLTNMPWRKLGVSYKTNEIFFDIIEEVDAIFDVNGLMVMCEISGTIHVTCSLSGMPDLTLKFTNPRLIDDVSLHPCVRLNRWERERVLSFVPPDGPFVLGKYRVRQQIQPPIYCKPTISYMEGSGRLTVMVGPKNTMGKLLEHVAVTIPFPKAIASVSMDADLGETNYDDMTRVAQWKMEKIPKDKSPMLNGTISVTPGLNAPDCNPTCRVHFKLDGFSVSGLKVDTLLIHNESYKPYKGVRFITKAGRFEVRT